MHQLTFEEFEKHIMAVIQIIELQDDLFAAGRKIKGSEFSLSFPTLIDNVIELLGILLNDKYEWISYWMFELYCGSKYKDGMITDRNGENIRLKTIRDLWNLLKEEESEK